MLLTSLTADELERLAYIEPARPGVQASLARARLDEIAHKQWEIDTLEVEIRDLENGR